MEGRITEKRGKSALEWAASMMVAVSCSSFKKTPLTFSSIISLLTFYLFIFYYYYYLRKVLWQWLGLTKIVRNPLTKSSSELNK